MKIQVEIKLRVQTLVLFCLTLVASSVFSSDARACSCGPSPPPLDALEGADTVFRGKVTDATDTEFEMMGELWEGRSFTFQAVRIWKGSANSRIIVTTGMGYGDCGYQFQKGEEYLVYAYENDNGLRTNICTRTAHIADAAVDLKALPNPSQVFHVEYRMNWWITIVAVVLALCLGGAISVWWLKQDLGKAHAG